MSYTGCWEPPPKVFVLAHAADFTPWRCLVRLPVYAACWLREPATVEALAWRDAVHLVDLLGGLDRVRDNDTQRRLLCAVDRLDLAGKVQRCSPDDVEAIADAWRIYKQQRPPFELDWADLVDEQIADVTAQRVRHPIDHHHGRSGGAVLYSGELRAGQAGSGSQVVLGDLGFGGAAALPDAAAEGAHA